MNKIFYDYIVNKTVGGNMAGVMQKAPNFGPRLKFLTNETEIYKFTFDNFFTYIYLFYNYIY